MGADLWHCHWGMKAVSDAHWNKYGHLNNSSFHTHKCTGGQIPIHTPASTLQFWPEKNKTLTLKWDDLCFEDWIFVPEKGSTSRQSAGSMLHSCAAQRVPLPDTGSRSSGSGVFMSRRVKMWEQRERCFAFCRSERWNNTLTAVSGREVSRIRISRSWQLWSILHKDAFHHQDSVYRRQPAVFQHHRTSARVPAFPSNFLSCCSDFTSHVNSPICKYVSPIILSPHECAITYTDIRYTESPFTSAPC